MTTKHRITRRPEPVDLVVKTHAREASIAAATPAGFAT
jgi:hypothetical protein